MLVERIAEPGAEWDTFAENSAGVTLGHAAGWAAVLRESYGLTPIYLAARGKSGEIAGILPLARFRTLRGTLELVSMPFHDAAGILARDSQAESALLQRALEITREEGALALELRQPRRLLEGPIPAHIERVNLTLALEADPEAQWKSLRAKVRNQTRKAEKQGLELGEGTSEELLEAFYGPFCVNMRDLGSPVHAREFYRAAARHFGSRLRFVVAMLGEACVGGLVAIRYGNRVTVPWASTLRQERSRCPNNLIYWEALRWAIAGGAGVFDFGRSTRDSGTHRFKLGWGAVEEDLPWLRLEPTGEPAAMTVAGQSFLLSRISGLWGRLPVPIASAVGPKVRRFFSN